MCHKVVPLGTTIYLIPFLVRDYQIHGSCVEFRQMIDIHVSSCICCVYDMLWCFAKYRYFVKYQLKLYVILEVINVLS